MAETNVEADDVWNVEEYENQERFHGVPVIRSFQSVEVDGIDDEISLDEDIDQGRSFDAVHLTEREMEVFCDTVEINDVIDEINRYLCEENDEHGDLRDFVK